MTTGALSFPKNKIRVLLLEGIHDSAVEYFTEQGYTNITRHEKALEGDDLRAELSKAHMVGIRSTTQLTAGALDSAEKLIAIGAFCIGTNQIDLTAAARCGVPVFNAPHSNTRSVAEMVL